MTTRTRTTQSEDHLRMARQTLLEMRDERSKFEIEKARNDSDRQHLRETCLAELNAQPEDLIASEAGISLAAVAGTETPLEGAPGDTTDRVLAPAAAAAPRAWGHEVEEA